MPDNKERHRIYNITRARTEETKEYNRSYAQSDARREYRRAFLASPEYKLSKAARRKWTDNQEYKQQFIDLCAQYRDCCLSCGRNVKMTLDHVIPLPNGLNDITNIQPLCASCNARKGKKTTDYRISPHHNCLGGTVLEERGDQDAPLRTIPPTC